MTILTIRSEKPEAELCLYVDMVLVDTEAWQAHRQLAETIHTKIAELLERNGKKLSDIGGIACFQGPGSFTGLRIGLTVANTLAFGLGAAVVASQGPNWQKVAVNRLESGETDGLAMPFYGSGAHITPPRK